MTDASYSVGLVVEASADARTATILIDRHLEESVEWLDEAQLDHLRAWQGVEPGTKYTKWSSIKLLARTHRVDPRGRFGDDPGKEDARTARRALFLFAKLGMPDLVVLVRDADDKPERREGLEQARRGVADPSRIVIGVAEPEREAWVVAGFMPCDEQETDALAAERKRLGFDPTRQPHELGGNGKRSAKTALANLLVHDPERERRCLVEPPLLDLHQRGRHTGLAMFLDEIEERIVPVVRGTQQASR